MDANHGGRMTDRIIPALVVLYTHVRDEFAARAEELVPQYGAVKFDFGWRHVPRQKTTQTSVIFVPGNEGGDAGKDLPPRQLDAIPRNLADFEELFTVYITGHVVEKPADDLANYSLTRLLYDEVRASIYRSSHGNTRIDSIKWNLTIGAELRLGQQLIVTGRIRAPQPDASETAPVEVNAFALLTVSSNNTSLPSVEVTEP